MDQPLVLPIPSDGSRISPNFGPFSLSESIFRKMLEAWEPFPIEDNTEMGRLSLDPGMMSLFVPFFEPLFEGRNLFIQAPEDGDAESVRFSPIEEHQPIRKFPGRISFSEPIKEELLVFEGEIVPSQKYHSFSEEFQDRADRRDPLSTGCIVPPRGVDGPSSIQRGETDTVGIDFDGDRMMNVSARKETPSHPYFHGDIGDSEKSEDRRSKISPPQVDRPITPDEVIRPSENRAAEVSSATRFESAVTVNSAVPVKAADGDQHDPGSRTKVEQSRNGVVDLKETVIEKNLQFPAAESVKETEPDRSAKSVEQPAGKEEKWKAANMRTEKPVSEEAETFKSLSIRGSQESRSNNTGSKETSQTRGMTEGQIREPFAAEKDDTTARCQAASTVAADRTTVCETGRATVDKADPPWKAYSPEIVQQVAKRLVWSVRNGEEKIRVKLEPPQLGSLYIEIERSKETVRAVLWTDNQQTKDILQGHQVELRKILEDNGFQLAQFDVYVDQNTRWFQEKSYGAPEKGDFGFLIRQPGQDLKTNEESEVLLRLRSTIREHRIDLFV